MQIIDNIKIFSKQLELSRDINSIYNATVIVIFWEMNYNEMKRYIIDTKKEEKRKKESTQIFEFHICNANDFLIQFIKKFFCLSY